MIDIFFLGVIAAGACLVLAALVYAALALRGGDELRPTGETYAPKDETDLPGWDDRK